MKQTHHIGYVQTPSVKNLSNVKNALVENGLVPLTTPNEMLPDAIEKGLENLKPENIRGNVKIGNVVGSIIETLADVNVNDITDYTVFEIQNSPFSKLYYIDGNYLYGIGADYKYYCYNKIDATINQIDIKGFNSDINYLSFYKNPTTGYLYFGGNTNNLYNTSNVSYVYKDKVSGYAPVYIHDTGGAAHVGEYTYIFGNGSNTGNIAPHILRFHKDQYIELPALGTKSTFYKALCVINDVAYFLVQDSSNTSLAGIYKLKDKTYEKIYSVSVSNRNYVGVKVYEDTAFIMGSGITGVFKIKNETVTKIYETAVESLFNESFVIYKTNNNTYIITPNVTSTQYTYILPKNANTLLKWGDTASGEIKTIIEDGDYLYLQKNYSYDLYMLYNNELSIIHTFTSNSHTSFVSSKGEIFVSSSPDTIKIKNGVVSIAIQSSGFLFFFFEDIEGNVYAGGTKIYKITNDVSSLVYTHPVTLSKVVTTDNGIVFLLSSSSSTSTYSRVVAFKNGNFTPLFSSKELIMGVYTSSSWVGYPTTVANSLLMETWQSNTVHNIYMIEEKNSRFVTYLVKTLRQ